jgi:transcription elongation GreA/GreB family factor
MQKPRVITFTKEGFEKIKAEYETVSATRPDAVEHLKRARELGDLSENGYYKASRQKLSAIDARLRELTHLMKYAKIVTATNEETITVGVSVKLRDGDREITYAIVGDYEADPALLKLSARSPLGAALLGKRKGDSVMFVAPSGKREMTILSISTD